MPDSILGIDGAAMDKRNKVLAFVVYNLVREGRESTGQYSKKKIFFEIVTSAVEKI